MKKLKYLLLAFLGLGGLQTAGAQGWWTGSINGVDQTLRPVDMNGSTVNAQLRVSIGLGLDVVPSAQLHTTGTVRFGGITQDNSYNRVMVLNTLTGDVRWRDAATLGAANANGWQITGNGNATASSNIFGTLNNTPVRFFTNNAHRATLNNNGFFVHPALLPTGGVYSDGTALGAYGKIRTQILGAYVNGDYRGVPASTMNRLDGTTLGGTGIVENRAGDSYLRGYWGVVIDKYGGGASFNGFNDNSYTNGAMPEPGCFAIRTRVNDVAGGNGNGFQDDFRTDFIVRRNGRTGIGTSNPTWVLDVNGPAGGTQQWIASDKRLKKNVEPIHQAMALVSRLDGVYYDYDHDRNPQYNLPKERSAGFLAQDLEKVFPVAVATKDDGFKAVNYDALIPLLTEALKEQDERINRLEAQLEDARMQLARLTNGQTSDAFEEVSVLYQNVPNPTRDATLIRYKLAPQDGKNAGIRVFDLSGRLLKKFENLPVGEGEVQVPVKDLQPGMYLYALIAGNREIATLKMIVE